MIANCQLVLIYRFAAKNSLRQNNQRRSSVNGAVNNPDKTHNPLSPR
jgi:hypothetical protein